MSISPQEIINKANSNKSGLKPKASQRGLSEMFKPQHVVTSVPNKALSEIVESNTPVAQEDAAIDLPLKKKKAAKKVRKSSKKVLTEKPASRSLSFKVDSSVISPAQFAILMNFASKIYAHDFKLLSAILIKTDFGQTELITIDEADIKEHGLRKGSAIKESRENLERLGIISCTEAYKSEKANRPSVFISLENINL